MPQLLSVRQIREALELVVGGVPYTQAQAAPRATLPVQITDETSTDEELDQEWVRKAKSIVEQTKSDPFTQSNELNKVKTEYLKARFNKELSSGGKPSQ